jgi:AraC-like DNA-binding protein
MALATPLSVVIKPARVVHANRVGPWGARTLQVSLENGAAETLAGAGDGLDAWRWLHAGPGTREFLTLARAVRCPRRQGRRGRQDLGNAVRSLLRELASPHANHLLGDRAGGDRAGGDRAGGGRAGGGRAEDATREVPHWLRRIRCALEEAEAGACAVSDLARRVGIHRVSLARAFRRHYGVTPRDYRKRHRLRRAALAIERTGWDLTRVAHESGYADHSHMCRQFREATGMAPSELRALAGAA